MTRRFCWMSWVLLFAALAGSTSQVFADEVETGIVEGRVSITQADIAKWRYSRFYVRKKGENSVAEAVVALRGTQLKSLKRMTPAKDVEIDQVNFQFEPETTAIRAGTTVKFLNNEGATHNVRAAHSAANFNENLPGGGDFSYVFRKATGIADPVVLGCVYHGNMRAFIYVFDQPFFVVTGTPGTFRFEGVPVGELQLDVAHAAGQLKKTQRVEIRKGETTKVEVLLSLPEPGK